MITARSNGSVCFCDYARTEPSLAWTHRDKAPTLEKKKNKSRADLRGTIFYGHVPAPSRQTPQACGCLLKPTPHHCMRFQYRHIPQHRVRHTSSVLVFVVLVLFLIEGAWDVET